MFIQDLAMRMNNSEQERIRQQKELERRDMVSTIGIVQLIIRTLLLLYIMYRR